jgi:hypothetical protein
VLRADICNQPELADPPPFAFHNRSPRKRGRYRGIFYKAVYLTFHNPSRQSRIGNETQRKNRVGLLLQGRVQLPLRLFSYTGHASPEAEPATIYEYLGVVECRDRNPESRILDSGFRPKLDHCSDEQHSFARVDRQFASIWPERLFVRVFVPRPAVIGRVAANPYWVVLEVFHIQLTELF